jgi:transcriptional regulator with XRE-family HTH domain
MTKTNSFEIKPGIDLLPESEGKHRYDIFLRKFVSITNSRRNIHRVTDHEVSIASGISRQTINALRNCKTGKAPSLESAIRILATLGYEVQIKEMPVTYKIKRGHKINTEEE